MAYRFTKKAKEQRARRLRAMRAGHDRARMAQPLEPRAAELPDLRMVIEVTRYDFGEEHHRFELRKGSRVDLYNASCDGRPWVADWGLSRILAEIRKAMPRVRAELD